MTRKIVLGMQSSAWSRPGVSSCVRVFKVTWVPRRYLSSSLQTHARKSFGSFHSEDIETLVRMSSADFHVPDIFHEIHDETVGAFVRETQQRPIVFGKDAKQRMYFVDENWTFVNHGAFGGTVRAIHQQAQRWRLHCERQPLRFFDRDLFPLVAHSIREIANNELHCPAEELLPLPNVTTGLNSIFQSLSQQLQRGDEVVYLSLTYGSTKKMIADLCERTGSRAVMVQLSLPIHMSDAEIVEQIALSINSHSKAIVIDAITSNTAMVLPVLAIAQRCKSINPNVQVIVDAAHALLSQSVSIYPQQIPSINHREISISDVVDYWLTNGHKWFSGAKGCAVMWLSPRVKHMRPAVVSHGFQPDRNEPHFASRDKILSAFSWDGCRDYSAFLALASTSKLWHSVSVAGTSQVCGDNRLQLREYNQQLLEYCEQRCREIWKIPESDWPTPRDGRQSESPMRLIPLPISPSDFPAQRISDREAFQLQEHLHHVHRIEVPVKCLEGRLYVRISAHIYNTREDFDKLVSAIQNITMS